MERNVRKKIRLSNYDYSSVGAYFITVCVNKHINLFWNKDNIIKYCNELSLPLSDYGMVVYEAIHQISNHYTDVYLDRYVIMPNHLHMIIIIAKDVDKAEKSRDIFLIVNQFKGYVTKKSENRYGRDHITTILSVENMITRKFVSILKIIRQTGKKSIFNIDVADKTGARILTQNLRR